MYVFKINGNIHVVSMKPLLTSGIKIWKATVKATSSEANVTMNKAKLRITWDINTMLVMFP